MIIKKNNTLYTLILILNLTLSNILNNNTENPQNNITAKEELDIIENPKNNIDFEEFKKIMQKLMSIFDNIMQKGLENNKSQEDIFKLFEALDFNKTIQPIVIKYFNNMKLEKNSKKTDLFSLDELKIFLKFLYNFILAIEDKNNIDSEITELNINQINSIDDLNIIIETLIKKYIPLEKSSKTATLNTTKNIIEDINSIIDSLLTLIKNIITNINKGKYLKHGLYNDIFHPGKKKKTKENIRASEFQNELLLHLFKHLNNNLQKHQLLLHEINNLTEEIPEKKLKQLAEEIMNEIINILATSSYFLNESKFYPMSKKFSIKDEKLATAEIENIHKKTQEYRSQLIKKHHLDVTRSSEFDHKKLLKNINEIKKIVANNIEIELTLTLFPIQNCYRWCVFKLEHLSNSNDVTKFVKKIISPKNWLTFFAGYVIIDSYLWLARFKEYGIIQSILKTAVDGWQFIQHNGSISEHKGVYISAPNRVNLHILEMHQALKESNLDFLAKNLQILPEGKRSIEYNLNPELQEKENKLKTDNEKWILRNRTPEINKELNWCYDVSHRHHEKLDELAAIKNNDIHQIAGLITYDILKSYNPEGKLKEICIKNDIKDLSNLNAIIQATKELNEIDNEMTQKLKIYKEQWIINNHRDSIGGALDRIPCGHILGASVIGFGVKKCGNIILENGFTYYLEQFWKYANYFLMGDRYVENSDFNEEVNIDIDSFSYNLYDKTFDKFEKDGILDWFKHVVNFIEASCNGKSYNGSEKITKCIGLFGPSGSGKTCIVRAFAHSILDINKKYKTEIPVQFLSIDPKHFNGIIQNGKNTKVDIIAELTGILEEIRLKGGFYIIHLDEFHLFFTKDGQISQERLADLLKFFNDLFVKQKNYKRLGGMYVICSTNKPQFIPHEFFDNGDRIGEIYEIQYPSGEEIISILKKELSNNNVLLDHIDFNYLIPLVEESKLTYGTIIKIANKAFNYAKIKHRTIDNEILYYAINDVVRKIILNDAQSNKYTQEDNNQNSIAAYYGALGAVAINFNHNNNNIYELDMLTILPLKQNFFPQHIDRLYLKTNIENIKIGEAFYAKTKYNNTLDAATTAVEIIKSIAPTVYLDLEKIPKINQHNPLGYIYDMLYHYFALKIKYADSAQRIEISNQKRDLGKEIKIANFDDIYNNPELHKHILNILSQTEKELILFYSQPEVKAFIQEVSQLLKENKIVTKKDILNNPTCQSLLEKINVLFDELLIKVKNQLI